MDSAARNLVQGAFGVRTTDFGWDRRRDFSQDGRVDAVELSIVVRNQWL